VVVIAGLWFARGILLPFALGILLSFLLAPVVGWVEKCKCPRIPAVLSVVAIAFAGVGLLSSVIGYELYDLAKRLPSTNQHHPQGGCFAATVRRILENGRRLREVQSKLRSARRA
jgi:predicted PurR-regulated permease PerM